MHSVTGDVTQYHKEIITTRIIGELAAESTTDWDVVDRSV